MPDHTCDECGDDLIVAEESTKEVVRIEPCETCRNESYDIGFRESEEATERRLGVAKELTIDPLLKGGEDVDKDSA